MYYSALNFRDVMFSTGKIAANGLSDCVAGLEYSGITKSGRRVMGVPNVPSIGLQVMSDPLFTWDVPNSWSLEDAATVPVIYATVSTIYFYYCYNETNEFFFSVIMG